MTTNTSHVQIIVDPGLAYIDGYRVATNYNTYLDIGKANTTAVETNQTATVNYGNYVYVNELIGRFQFKAGATVSLRSAAKQAITTSVAASGTSLTPAGSEIGTARMRSLVVDSGTPGTSTCVYRLYLFDVIMNPGFSFRDVRSFWYDGAVDGIADAVTVFDATTNKQKAVLNDSNLNTLIFPTGDQAIKGINNFSYQYKTISGTTLQLSSTGTLQITSTFPYSDGQLTSTQEREFVVTPIANTEAAANIAGSMVLTATNAIVTGTSTTFASSVAVGDFVKFANATTSVVRQVVSIANNTEMTLNSNGAAMTANAVLFFPALYPISVSNRADRTITISSSGTVATLDVGQTLSSTVNAFAVYTVQRTNASPVPKAINRDLFVKIHTSNNVAGATGPWCLGVPGIARLKKVYSGSNTTVNTSSTDITKYFYIDVNDDESAYRPGFLSVKDQGSITLTANQFLLVQFDAFTTNGAEGFFTANSYSINDTLTLTNSTSTINTLEIPETVDNNGKYYDLRDVVDFRPYSTATANLQADFSNTFVTVNPANTFALSGDDQFFPVPDSPINYDVVYYLPRKDLITIDTKSQLQHKAGSPSLNPKPPKPRQSTLGLAYLTIPPYPTLPRALNTTTQEFASKKVGSERGEVNIRQKKYSISADYGAFGAAQPQRYTMSNIAALERRLENVEYAVALSELENSIVNSSLPSGISPTIDRFKHAFFVDPFDDFSRSDTVSKEYTASVDPDSTRLVPQTVQLNFESRFDTSDAGTAALVSQNVVSLPYTTTLFADQSVKSGVIGSDGTAKSFAGTMTITPSSFSLLSHVVITKDPPVNYVDRPGESVYRDGGGGDRGSRGGEKGEGGGGTDTRSFAGFGDQRGNSSGGGGGGGGRVICTHFYRKGMLTQAVWRADLEFSYQRISPTTVRGYHFWAIPYVQLMRKSPLAEKIMFPIAKWRAEELAYQMGVLEKGNFKGKLVRAVLEPICFVIGLFVKEQNWQRLYQPQGSK